MHHSSFSWNEKNSCHSCESKPSSFIWVVVECFFLKQKWKNSNMHNFNHHGSFVLVKVSTPCQGSYTLFLCESRFWHLAKVSTPCFLWVKVSTPCQGFHTLFLCESRFPTLFLCESRFPQLAKVPTPCFYVSQGFHSLPGFPHLVSM